MHEPLGDQVRSEEDQAASPATSSARTRQLSLILVPMAARAIERYDELYLINKFQQGEARFRLLPTQADRSSFFACVMRGAGVGGQDPSGQAYRFFRSHVELLGPEEEPFDLDRLTAVVVERLAVVDITTGQGDNAHRIFQSLNATGST